jgi:spermidine synthase
VHPGLQSLATPRRVLVLGGGDGLAIREVLKRDSVEQITLVDLDPEMTRLFSQNGCSLTRGLRLSKVASTPMRSSGWNRTPVFCFAVVDFPDPTNHSLGIYTVRSIVYSTSVFQPTDWR